MPLHARVCEVSRALSYSIWSACSPMSSGLFILIFLLWQCWRRNPPPNPNAVNPGSQFSLLPRDLLIPWSSTFPGLKRDETLLELFRMTMLWGGLFAAIGSNKVVNWRQPDHGSLPPFPRQEWAACGIGNSLTATRVHGKIIKAGNLLHILSSSGMLS